MKSFLGRETRSKGQLSSKSDLTLRQSESDCLQTAIDRFIMKLEKERREGALLDHSISQLESQLQEAKDSRQESGQTKKLNLQITVLQKKQELALAQLGETRAGNKAMKGRIDDIRRELQSCQEAITRVSSDLTTHRSQAITALSTRRQTSRIAELNQQKIQILRSKSVNERLNYASRLQEMSEVIHKDGESKSSYLRQVEDLFQEVLRRPVDHIDVAPVQKTLIEKWTRKVRAKKADLDEYQRYVKGVGEVFEQIRIATGIGNIHEIVTGLVKSEEQMFALYTHVDELTSEIDVLEEGLGRNKRMMEEHKQTGGDIKQARSIRSQAQSRLSASQVRVQSIQLLLDTLRDALHTAQTPASTLYDLVTTTGALFHLPTPSETNPSLLQMTGEIEDRLEVMLSSQNTETSSVQWSIDALSPKRFTGVRPSVSSIQVQQLPVPEEEEFEHIKVPLNEILFRQRLKRKLETQTPDSRSKSVGHW